MITKTETKRGRGRPTDYESRFVEMARVACADLGATDVQIGRLFGVTAETIRVWKREYPEFSVALKEGKDQYDREVVEKNLLRRANGYKVVEITEEPDKSGEMKVVKRVRKEVPPDVTSMIFWLKNRSAERWRDTKHISGDMNMRISHEEALDALS